MPNGDERVACARLLLHDTAPVRWELATRVGQDVSQLNPGEIFGYPVDAGLGCFMDAAAAALLDDALDRLAPDDNYYDGVLAKEIEANDRPTWSFADHRPSAHRRENVIAFSSGWGDGFYASVWGFDDSETIVCLVTDFRAV